MAIKAKLGKVFKKTVKTIQSLKKARKKLQEKAKESAPIRSTSSKQNVMKLEIAPLSAAKSTVAVLLVLALAYFLIEISEILLLFFVSFLFTAGLDHAVTDLQQKFKIPRALSVIVFYILIFAILAIMLGNLAPLVADQISALANKTFEFINNVAEGRTNLPFADKLAPYFHNFTEGVDIDALSAEVKTNLQQFSAELLSVGQNVWSAIIVISNGLINTSIVLVLTFFMIVDWQNIEGFFVSLFPSKHSQYICTHLDAVKRKIGYWLRGQLLLSVAIGILSYILLLIIGMEYAVTLALIAAFTELIPVVGPLIAWLVALPVAGNMSFLAVIWLTVGYVIIQQIESNILIPLIMQKTVGLSPIMVMFAMLVGYTYLGILGVILSIPVTASLAIFVRNYAQRESKVS